MGFIKRIKNMFKQDKRSNNFSKWFEPFNVFRTMNNETLASNEIIFSAVTRLSNAMASLPLKIYKNYEIINNDMSVLISSMPNANMTSFDFIRLMETHRNTYGNAYALKRYNDNYQIIGLDVIDPLKVEVFLEKNSKELYYCIDAENGKYYIHNYDMIHVKHIHSKGFKGISPLDVLKGSIDYDRKVKEFSINQMDNGLKASFVLNIATHLADENKKVLLESFKNFYSNSGNGVILLDSGIEIKELNNNFIDPKVFEVERITKSRVATVYNLPPHMLGDFKDTNYSSMEQQSLEFVQNTLLPIIRMYEQEFNKKLLTHKEHLQGLTFKFNVNAFLRGDIKTRGDFYFKGIRSGWFSPNEVRALEELPPQEGGSNLYMSRDLSPIKSLQGDETIEK